MNHLNKNPDAHCRLAREARCVQVRGFSRAYQRSTEFKARQLWLDFQDAVGTALEAIAEVVDGILVGIDQFRKSVLVAPQGCAHPFEYDRIGR